MPRQIPGDIGEKLFEQAKHTGTGLKQAPKTVFQRLVGEKTDEEKKAEKEKEEAGIEDTTAGTSGQKQPLDQTDLKRQQIEAEKKAKYKRMQKLFHKRLFEEADKARKKREEEERLHKMKEEGEKQKKQKKQMDEIKQKEKEEALAVQVAKRAKGAGEFGPRKPK